MVVALAAPLVVNALPALRVPSPVLEILAGIVLGPSVLGWVHVDAPVQVPALIGLAFLLFLAGLILPDGDALVGGTVQFVAFFDVEGGVVRG